MVVFCVFSGVLVWREIISGRKNKNRPSGWRLLLFIKHCSCGEIRVYEKCNADVHGFIRAGIQRKKIYRMKRFHLSTKVQPMTAQTGRLDISARRNNTSSECFNTNIEKSSEWGRAEFRDGDKCKDEEEYVELLYLSTKGMFYGFFFLFYYILFYYKWLELLEHKFQRII